MRSRIVYGVAINDADYNIVVSKRFGNKVVKFWTCPFYTRWKNMLLRCYSAKYQSERSTYKGCSVCDEWLTFSNFKRWMEQQDWQGNCLDKDIIKAGNKVYCPEFCAFVPASVNNFVLRGSENKGKYPVGVALKTGRKKLVASAGKNIYMQSQYVGHFDDEDSAHEAWKARKHEIACKIAESISDERVANALRSMYLS